MRLADGCGCVDVDGRYKMPMLRWVLGDGGGDDDDDEAGAGQWTWAVGIGELGGWVAVVGVGSGCVGGVGVCVCVAQKACPDNFTQSACRVLRILQNEMKPKTIRKDVRKR